MTNITQHIPKRLRRWIPRVMLSAQAEAELTRRLHKAGLKLDAKSKDDLASNAASFYRTIFFMESQWFQMQRVHTALVLVITREDEREPIIMHLVRHRNTITICTPEEAPLPEHYFEQRVIQEAMAETPYLH